MSWVANVEEKKKSQNKILPIAILYIAFTFGSQDDIKIHLILSLCLVVTIFYSLSVTVVVSYS